jgi:radical SAM/Cys-rich protein
MLIKSLHARLNKLADTTEQLDLLNGDVFKKGILPTFREKLQEVGKFPLKPNKTDIFQMNIGYMCNQTCKHCHVDAGPDRKEMMSRETMEQCLSVVRSEGFPTVDITGGAPEMHPDFRWLVQELKKAGAKEIIVRCNLTILLANPKYHDLPAFYAEHDVRVVSSLPFYAADRTDRQRGEGVFEKSIKALQMLNSVGYGKEGSGLILDLVYNPAGAFLPADQKMLERDFKSQLSSKYQIDFNSLLCITNVPVSRYLEYLENSGNLEDYMDLLVRSFNSVAVEGVMCKNTLSVGFDGYLYDCDFNQMLALKVDHHAPQHISAYHAQRLMERQIVINQHCFGCTAGAGSSCQGSTV